MHNKVSPLLSSPPKANRNRPCWTSNNNTTTTSIWDDENQTSKWGNFQFQLVKISTNSFSTILNKSEGIHIHTSNMEIDYLIYYYRRAEEKTPRLPKSTLTQLTHFGWWWALFWVICKKSLKATTLVERLFCHFVIKTLRIFP